MRKELISIFLIGIIVLLSPVYAATKAAQKRESSEGTMGPGKKQVSAWNAFNKSKKWKIAWDKRTGTPHRISGYHLKIAEGLNKRNAEKITRSIIAKYKDLFGVGPEELRFFKADFVKGSNRGSAGTWYVYFHQVYKKLRVVGGSLRFVIKNQQVTSISADLYPGIKLRPAGKISKEAAIRIASKGSGKGGRLVPEKAELVVLPRNAADKVRYHLSWRIVTPLIKLPGEQVEPSGKGDGKKTSALRPVVWQFFIDAETGEVLERRNLILEDSLSGTVTGMVYLPSPLNPQQELPLSKLTVTVTQNPATFNGVTDGTGAFLFNLVSAGTATVEARLAGPNVVITNQETSVPSTHTAAVNCPGTHSWNWQTDDASPGDVETNAFYHVNFIRDWFSRGGPFNVIPAGRNGYNYVEAVVREPDVCNAYASPGAGLLEFGGGTAGCVDLGLCSQVIYHEYGHLILQQIYDDAGVPMYTDDAAAMHEGFADYFGESINNDPINANGCGGDHRNADMPDMRYPDNYSFESHQDGLIISGAVWDLRKILGTPATDSLAIRALKHGETAFSDYLGALIEEDDDPAFSAGGNNDLSDSTPNIHAICGSFFALHGIYHAYCAGHTAMPVAIIRAPSPLRQAFNVFNGSSPTITVSGSAQGSLGNPLSNYALEYADERNPAVWMPIHSGTTPVDDAVLGAWDISSVKDGYYTVRLTVTDAANNSSSASTAVVLDRALKSGWPQHKNEFFPTPPLAADFDPAYPGLEIVARERWGSLYLWHADGTAVPGWPKSILAWPLSAPALLEGQGELRLAVAAIDAGNTIVYVFNKNGAAAGWPQTCPGEISDRISPVTGDFDGDGRAELAIGTTSTICVWDRDGVVKPGWPYTPGSPVTTALAAGDIDGDGSIEIVAGTDNGSIFAFNMNGNIKPGWGVQKFIEPAEVSPVLADLNGDGRMEIAIGSQWANVYVFGPDGTLLSGWPQALHDQFESFGLAAADVNGDGKPELIISTYKKISVWDHQANLLTYSVNACQGGIIQRPVVVGDIVPDSAVETIVASDLCFGRGITKIHAVDKTGSAVADWSKYMLATWGRSAPVIADIDNDQEWELMVNGFGISIWELPGSTMQVSEWPDFRHDAKRTACRPLSSNLVSDQTNTTSPTGLSMGCGLPPMGLGSMSQSFTPTKPSLERVDLRLRAGGSFPAGGYSTIVNIRKGTTDGAILGTATVLVSGPVSTGAQVDIAFAFPTPIALNPGEVYVIEWKTPIEGDRILTWMAATGNPYPGGTAYGCSGSSIADDDFLFATYFSRRSCP